MLIKVILQQLLDWNDLYHNFKPYFVVLIFSGELQTYGMYISISNPDGYLRYLPRKPECQMNGISAYHSCPDKATTLLVVFSITKVQRQLRQTIFQTIPRHGFLISTQGSLTLVQSRFSMGLKSMVCIDQRSGNVNGQRWRKRLTFAKSVITDKAEHQVKERN